MKQAAWNNGHEFDLGSPYAACHFPREAAMSKRWFFVAFLFVVTIGFTPAFAGDFDSTASSMSIGITRSVVVEAAYGGPHEPRISGTLHPKTERKLREAFSIAIEQVHGNPECGDLFTQLEADGLEKLSTSLYYRPTPVMERRVCRAGVSAFTFISSPQVRLCNRFASLATEKAAIALIHEALHFAGLSESPGDPDGPSPGDIDRMVRTACGF